LRKGLGRAITVFPVFFGSGQQSAQSQAARVLIKHLPLEFSVARHETRGASADGFWLRQGDVKGKAVPDGELKPVAVAIQYRLLDQQLWA
jgi:hypothetical protein